MNKTLFLIFTLFFSNFIFAQSVNDLDLKNGFRHFKLGSSPAQIKNIVRNEEQFSSNPEVITYRYVGHDISYIFDVQINQIRLMFFKNKLVSISVLFGGLEYSKDFELFEFNKILWGLKNIYGSDVFNPKNNNGNILNGAIWDGKKVRLEFLRFDSTKSDINTNKSGFINGYINVFDKKLDNQMVASDF